MHKQQVATHQDGQHDILEVFPQVGGVCAEEDKIVLHQLHTTSRKESHEIAAPNVTEIERGICSPLIRRPARDPLASIGPAFFFFYLNGHQDEEEGGGENEVWPVTHHHDEAAVERNLLLRLWCVWI